MDYTVHGILQARILECVAFPFSRGSSQTRNWTRSPALQVDSLPAELSGKCRNGSVIGGTPIPVMGFPGGSDSKESACKAGNAGLILGLGRSWEKEMATHSSILAWEIHGQWDTVHSSQRVELNWVTNIFTFNTSNYFKQVKSSIWSQYSVWIQPPKFPLC